MNLSSQTVEILKNFSTINESIQIKPGNIIKTISPLKTIFAQTEVIENFKTEFCIYDLNKFLSKLSLHKTKDVELEFDIDAVVIKSNNGTNRDRIKFCSPKVIATPPDKTIELPSVDYKFNLQQGQLERIRRTAAVSASPNIIFSCDGSEVTVIAKDVTDDSSDVASIIVGNLLVADAKFEIVLKFENLKLIDDDYIVSISKKGLINFKGMTSKVEYFVAIESESSTFD